MPRPTRPQNYASFWYDLVNQLARSTKDLVFEFDNYHEAYNHRITFHSFRAALFAEARRPETPPDRAADFRHQSIAAGNFTVLIRSVANPSLPDKKIPRTNHKVHLIFRLRDNTEDTKNLQSQLEKQVGITNSTRNLAVEEAEQHTGAMEDMVQTYISGERK